VSTADEVAHDLIGFGLRAVGATHAAVVTHTAILHRTVVANASGRPGPEAPTGDYRRSISRQVVKGGSTSEGFVGTNAPQARRLELGFTGTDSLGRSYDQPPFPHFGPAADEVRPGFEATIAAIPAAAAQGLKPLPTRRPEVS
jgi:hypothetical protein